MRKTVRLTTCPVFESAAALSAWLYSRTRTERPSADTLPWALTPSSTVPPVVLSRMLISEAGLASNQEKVQNSEAQLLAFPICQVPCRRAAPGRRPKEVTMGG